MPTLVLKDRDTLATAAHVISTRADNQWVVRQTCRDLKRWGILNDVIFRCDQERVLIDHFHEVMRQRQADRGARSFVEHNPVGDSQKAGFIEAGVKAVEGSVRAILYGLEEKLGCKISVTLPVFAWLVEHAAECLNLFRVGFDGKTPYERQRGKPWGGTVIEFGSRVQHRTPGKTRCGSMEARWHSGIFLGMRVESQEFFVALEDGSVVRASAVEPFTEETRWNADLVKGVKGTPWATAGTVRADPQVPQRADVNPAEQEAEGQAERHAGFFQASE